MNQTIPDDHPPEAINLLNASGPMIAGVIDSLRQCADQEAKGEMVGPLTLAFVMQRAEAVEQNLSRLRTILTASPNPIDYIGQVIMQEGHKDGILSWVAVDYDSEDHKMEIEKVLNAVNTVETDHGNMTIDNQWTGTVLEREWMPFMQVRRTIEAWRYPVQEHSGVVA